MLLNRRWLSAAVLFSMILPVFGKTVSCDARGGLFRRHRQVAKPVPAHQAPHPTVQRHVVPQAYDWRRLNDDPRYYGGFHHSYFESIGLPQGDIGPRGNQIYLTPW